MFLRSFHVTDSFLLHLGGVPDVFPLLRPKEMGLVLLFPRPMGSFIRIAFFLRVYNKPPDVGPWDSAEDESSILLS